jgi:hypothetical protein
MDIPCPGCWNHPAGLIGHADLMAHTLGERKLAFQCRRCGRFWSRLPSYGAGFTWTAVSQREACCPTLGVLVPPSSISTKPRPLPLRTAFVPPMFGSSRNRRLPN